MWFIDPSANGDGANSLDAIENRGQVSVGARTVNSMAELVERVHGAVDSSTGYVEATVR